MAKRQIRLPGASEAFTLARLGMVLDCRHDPPRLRPPLPCGPQKLYADEDLAFDRQRAIGWCSVSILRFRHCR